jgi:hypothetical protein
MSSSSEQGRWLDVATCVLIHSYAEFVSMSKEIATLENDMLELKDLLGQWKDLPQLMGMEDTLAPTLDKHGNCTLSLSLSKGISANRSGTTPDAAQLDRGPRANVQGAADESVVHSRRIPKVHSACTRSTPRIRDA